jgi:CheY-like chemotaxis protein
MTRQPVNILLVDDDEVDQESIRREFARLQMTNPLLVARDGEEALEVLRRPAILNRRANLIVADLGMPRMNGLEFLRELRSDPRLCRSIVFVLTTSAADSDKLGAYSKHVAGYLRKANLGSGLEHLAAFLHHYQRCVEFPPP